jgi:hypothetical protein
MRTLYKAVHTLVVSLSLLCIAGTCAIAQTTPPTAGASDTLKLPDAAKMPDVVGVRLGMPAIEALQIVHKELPADRYLEMKASGWPTAQKPVYGFNIIKSDQLGTPDVGLFFTAPPAGPQLLWRMTRYAHNMHVNHATLLAALRQKYGKESFAADEGGNPTTDDHVTAHLIWLFDERGARAPMPPVQTFGNAGSIWQCVGRSNILDPESQLFVMGNPAPNFPVEKDPKDWCSSAFVGLHIGFHSSEIVEKLFTEMLDMPLAGRTARVSEAWLRAGAERARQSEIEKSKQSKPVL